MGNRVYNFNAGPSAMPLPVLEEIQQEFLDFNHTGMSIVEISHRSDAYQKMQDETIALLRKLLNITDEYGITFMQGGGSMQFLMHGANFLKHRGGYINTGVWSKKAKEGAAFYGDVYDVATSEGEGFRRIPGPEEFDLLPDSDFLSRPVDVKNFDFIYAGIQKNVGPAGAVIGIAKHSYLETARQDLPIMLQYKTFFDHDSTYNTPPVFCIYFVNKVLHWLDERGGLKETERINKEKAAFVYDAIDASEGFYRPHAAKDSRSLMNITFNLDTPELEKEFVSRAAEEKLIGLKGHRSIGGCRASTYNAVTKEACERLADFMHRFRKAH